MVLSYDEFGPQVFVYQYIGDAWYQWNTHGDSDPNKRDAVYVVVYDGMSLQEAKRRYPVDAARLQDYRYLSLKEAYAVVSKVEKPVRDAASVDAKDPDPTPLLQTEPQRIVRLREKLRIHFQSNPALSEPMEEGVIVITQSTHLKDFVGKKVKLVGMVSNTKIPEILGVEVCSDSPDLRERMAEATGVLERYEVSAASVEVLKKLMVANRGAGTFYRLRDLKQNTVAQVVPR